MNGYRLKETVIPWERLISLTSNNFWEINIPKYRNINIKEESFTLSSVRKRNKKKRKKEAKIVVRVLEKKIKIKSLQWKQPPPCLIFKCFQIGAVQNSICNKVLNYINWEIYFVIVIKLLQPQSASSSLSETLLGQALLALIQESLIPDQTNIVK